MISRARSQWGRDEIYPDMWKNKTSWSRYPDAKSHPQTPWRVVSSFLHWCLVASPPHTNCYWRCHCPTSSTHWTAWLSRTRQPSGWMMDVGCFAYPRPPEISLFKSLGPQILRYLKRCFFFWCAFPVVLLSSEVSISGRVFEGVEDKDCDRTVQKLTSAIQGPGAGNSQQKGCNGSIWMSSIPRHNSKALNYYPLVMSK